MDQFEKGVKKAKKTPQENFLSFILMAEHLFILPG